jgi:hypothetical protein
VISAESPWLRAFGGGPLEEFEALRWAHIDEAGVSKNDKVTAVAGILSEPDKHYHALAAKLRSLEASVPEPLRQGGLIFHAKDIWHGNKRFDKDLWLKYGWDKERRRNLVLEICKIPAEFDLPVVMGFHEKEARGWDPILRADAGKKLTADKLDYALAFIMCAMMIEIFMQEHIPASEVAHIVAEDTNEMREHARWGYDLLRNPKMTWTGSYRNFLPMKRVVEDLMFSPKTRSSLLQIADSIAFVVSRNYAGHDDVKQCFNAFLSKVVYINPDYREQGA